MGRWMAAAALAMAAGTAHARQAAAPDEQEGPVIIGQNVGKYVWWDLQRFSSTLEFYGEFDYARQETNGLPTVSINDDRWRIDNDVQFESYIGHKNLIDLTGEFKLGYENHKITTEPSTQDVNENLFVDLYNVQALVLGEGPAPLTVYSQRDETDTSREFNTSIRSVDSESGAILSIKSDFAPTRLQYFHRDLKLTDDLSIDDNSTQDTGNIQTNINISEREHLEAVYDIDHIDETQSNNFSDNYNRQEGAATHTLDFGSSREHQWRSWVRYYDQSGLFPQSDLRMDNNVRLHHSDTLETRYNLTVDDQKYADQEQQVIAGNANLKHQLFKSLTTTANVGGIHVNYPDIYTSDDAYATILFDYTKKVPFGRIDASLGFAYDHQVNSDRGSNIFVSNEPKVFNAVGQTSLNHRNIVTGSIVMTNPTNTYTST